MVPPVITVPANVYTSTSTSQASVNIGIASATDNVDGMVAVTNNAPATFPIGVTTVTYTSTDLAGNTATATQNVYVSYSSTVGGGTGGGSGGTTTPPPAGGGATVSSEAVYWHHNDHLGTPQALTDINGTKVWEMSQTPFGIATVNEDPDGDGLLVVNNFRFPGQYYDAEIGLNYNYFRTFDPTLGRYTQSDPIGLNGGMNTFAYVLSNPISFIDPVGLSGIDAMIYGGISSTQAQGLSAAQQAPIFNDMWTSFSPSERSRFQVEFGSNLANQSAMAGSMCLLGGQPVGAVVGAVGFLAGKTIQYQAEPPNFYQALFDVASTLFTAALPVKAAVIATPVLISVDGMTKK